MLLPFLAALFDRICAATAPSSADNYNPSGNPTTYDSQSTFIFPYVHADGHTTFMWMADRWWVLRSGLPAQTAIRDHPSMLPSAGMRMALGGSTTCETLSRCCRYGARSPPVMPPPVHLVCRTNIWLPLVYNNASAPPLPSPGPGSVLFIEPCNAADPTQIFSINAANSTVTHVATGLCVIQTGGSGSQLLLAACSGSSQETWVPSAGSTLANGLPASNSGCLDFNNVNNVLPAGNPVIAYTCDDPPRESLTCRCCLHATPTTLTATARRLERAVGPSAGRGTRCTAGSCAVRLAVGDVCDGGRRASPAALEPSLARCVEPEGLLGCRPE